MTFVWDTSVMEHLHAQAQTIKKGDGALPPLLSEIMQAACLEARDHISTHAWWKRSFKHQPSNALVTMKITGWLWGVILTSNGNFHMKWQFHWGWYSHLWSPCSSHNRHLKATHFSLLCARIDHTALAYYFACLAIMEVVFDSLFAVQKVNFL